MLQSFQNRILLEWPSFAALKSCFWTWKSPWFLIVKSTCPYGFPMIFQSLSYGFPRIFRGISNDFLISSAGFQMVFLCFSYAFSMVFLLFSHDFSYDFMVFLGFSYSFPLLFPVNLRQFSAQASTRWSSSRSWRPRSSPSAPSWCWRRGGPRRGLFQWYCPW